MMLISSHDIRALVPIGDAIDAARQAFIHVSTGDVEQPTRLALAGGEALAMLARDRRDDGTVLKGVTVRSQEPSAHLPAVQALVVWFDGVSGSPQAVIDGTSLTALRTGAASAVATDLLARPDATVLGMIGAGGQAPDQIRAICAVRPIREVRVFSRTSARSAALVEEMAPELAPVRLRTVESASGAITEADVVCTATTARDPVFVAGDLPRTVHVNAIGSHTLEMTELPAETFVNAQLVAVDARDAAFAEAGDLVAAMHVDRDLQDRVVEVGTLLLDGFGAPGGWTIFKSVGIAAQDLFLARLVVKRALEWGDDIPRIEL
jgi:ornithine cyclodeaminase